MTVRGKFKCEEVTRNNPQTPALGSTVRLSVVADGTSEENKALFKYDPSGSIVLGVLAPEAAEQFEVGKLYYVDFKPAD